RCYVIAARRGMKVDRVIGIRLEQPVEQNSGVPGRSRGAVLISRPLPVEVDQVDAPPRVWPPARHAFHGPASYIENGQHRAGAFPRIQAVNDGLYHSDRADLVAMHAADECDALARSRTLRNHRRHMPMLACDRLHALKIEGVLPAGLQIIDIERANDLL